MTEQQALLVLNAVPLLDARKIRDLMAYFGSAVNIVQASLNDLQQCGLLTLNTIKNILHFSKDKFLQDEYNLMRHFGVAVLTSVDTDYPESLKVFDDAPVVLYIKGNIESLNQKSIAIVGSRAASYYGVRSSKRFAQAFAEAGLVVTSGLARGIDTAAHQGALEAGGKTIAVVACGFNYMYPKENYALMQTIGRQGAVISEFAFTMPPLRQNFPWRNRIISGLSLSTVVIEAGVRSGALITAGFTLSQNKDVFVLPANIDSPTALGGNRLIQDGAQVALSPDDVLEQIDHSFLSLASEERERVSIKKISLHRQEQRVYDHIKQEPVHVDDLCQRVGLPIGSLLNITLGLELKHAIRQLPGQYYVRNEHA